MVQAQADSISYRLQIAGKDTTLTSASLAIHSRGGSELVASTAATTDGAVATYSRTWDLATFEVAEGYKAVWSLVHAGGTISRESRFDVVRRVFVSQLADADLTELHPYISNQLPDGHSDFSVWRNAAWRRIYNRLRKLIQTKHATGEYDERWHTIWRRSHSPGNVFYPEDFFEAHLYLSLGMFFEQSAWETGGEDEAKAKQYIEEGWQHFDSAANSCEIDLNADGNITTSERGRNLSYITIQR